MGITPTPVLEAPLRDSPGLARKRFGAPSLGSLTSLSATSIAAEPKLNDSTVRKDSKIHFKHEDLEFIKKLGQGAGGTVSKVLHKPTGLYMARKIMKSVASDENQDKIEKQIMRELKIMRMCKSPFIVTFYGAFMHNDDISIMMEYMDLGTLDSVYQKTGPIPEKYVAKIASQLLQGLIYLYDNHKIVHRDIKPSNILLCSGGYAKIADFGVSKETAETLAMTFIGTQCFLAPERIKMNAPCSPASDVWALGLSMMEIAMAKFPFPSEAMGSYFDMMEFIIQQPSPTLPAGVFSPEFEEYCRLCLIKDPTQRPHPQKLIVNSSNVGTTIYKKRNGFLLRIKRMDNAVTVHLIYSSIGI